MESFPKRGLRSNAGTNFTYTYSQGPMHANWLLALVDSLLLVLFIIQVDTGTVAYNTIY